MMAQETAYSRLPVAAILRDAAFGRDLEREIGFNMESVRLATVGLGGWGKNVVRSFSTTRHCSLFTICDSDAGCLSFFPSKNLGAFGDASMVVTNTREVFERVEMLRRHGGKVKYHHTELGLNSRLDELQAAILRVKRPHLPAWTARRREIAARHRQAFRNMPCVGLQQECPESANIYHQFTIRVPDRDRVRQRLQEEGVETAIYYPVPLHLQEAYRSTEYPEGSFPHAERAARECLSLPIYPELTPEAQETVTTSVRSIVGRIAAGSEYNIRV